MHHETCNASAWPVHFLPRDVACIALAVVAMLLATCSSWSLQTNLAESQQSCSAKEDQLQTLSLELEHAQANASDLAKSHTETEQQLQQQTALLKQVQRQSRLCFDCCCHLLHICRPICAVCTCRHMCLLPVRKCPCVIMCPQADVCLLRQPVALSADVLFSSLICCCCCHGRASRRLTHGPCCLKCKCCGGDLKAFICCVLVKQASMLSLQHKQGNKLSVYSYWFSIKRFTKN